VRLSEFIRDLCRLQNIESVSYRTALFAYPTSSRIGPVPASRTVGQMDKRTDW